MTKPPRTAKMTPELIELAMRLRIAFALIARAQRRDVPEQLTPVQISALCKVELHGPIRLGDLAAHEQVAGPTMCRVVTSLENSGFVTRETDPTSARSSQVAITTSGRKQIDVVRRDRTHVMARRLSALSAEHRSALAAALPAIEALVESVEPNTGLALRELERSQRAARARRSG
ncbi:MAG: MarR family transcriptional regulator [Byssovorax sp.]